VRGRQVALVAAWIELRPIFLASGLPEALSAALAGPVVNEHAPAGVVGRAYCVEAVVLTSHITQATRVPPLDFSRLDESRPQWRCVRLLYDLGHARQRRSDVAARFHECFEAYGRQSGLVPYWPLPESPDAPPL
jgi:hypothetical protein